MPRRKASACKAKRRVRKACYMVAAADEGKRMARDGFDYDVLVIGSGFGGSVAALRLTEKGYRVGVLEAGRRFTNETLPKTSWDLRNFLWAPHLGLHGIQRITLVNDVLILSGAGVGGGSLVYANTLYEPLDAFYANPQWGHITDWRAELAPFYDQAKRMLGVVENPVLTPSDHAMRLVAEEMGVGATFRKTPVGGVFRRARQGGGRPLLRRRRTEPNRLRAMRRVHDRLPAQREEPAGPHLPVSGRAQRRGGASAYHRHRGAADAPVAGTRSRQCPSGTWRRQQARPSLPRPAGGVRRRLARDPAAAARDARRGGAAADLARDWGSSPAPTQNRSSARRPSPPGSTSPRAWRSPRRSSRTSTPISSPSATARAATRWACSARS